MLMRMGRVFQMENYEIRFVKGSGGPVILAGPHFNDHAAIGHARSFTGEQDIVEVWRGGDCIYARNVDHSPARVLMAMCPLKE
jgi:hypothetical protein